MSTANVLSRFSKDGHRRRARSLEHPARVVGQRAHQGAVESAGSAVQRHENIFVIGPTGVEKSFLASALAQKACRDGHLVLYIRAAALFRDLALARADGSLRNLLARLSRVDVLVIDILDRLVHNAHRIELRGESLRKNRSKKSESASPPAA